MKIRVNLWLTIFLFLMMILASIASSYIGYFMGSEALKVVTQPDINSDSQSANQEPLGGKYKGLKIIEEEQILREVYKVINKK
ncbi:MAG: hypothetical protein AAFR63_02060 [Cyanobacteria bacterium J06631_6]